MSEANDDNIEMILATLDESYDGARRPAHLDPVFEKLRMSQLELAERSFLSVEAAQTYVFEVIAQFEQECADKQMIPRPVRLTGTGITVPHHNSNPFTGQSITTALPVEEIDTHLPLVVQHQGVDGEFMGLSYKLTRLKEVDDNEEGAVPCQARLRYQVRVGGAPHFNGYETMAATGDVSTTQLEFTTDRRHRELTAIYDRLLETTSPDAARYIDRLLATLTQFDNYAPSTLKTVSNLVDLITQDKDFIDDVAKKDALEELLRFYISMQPTYALMVPDELEKTAEGYIPRTMTKSDEPICYDQKLASIILAPRYYKREGSFVLCPDKNVPYFVAIGEDKKVHYLPMGRMIGFYARD